SRDDNSNRRHRSTSEAKGRKFRGHDTPGDEKRRSNRGPGNPAKWGKGSGPDDKRDNTFKRDGQRPSHKAGRATYGRKPYDSSTTPPDRTTACTKQYTPGGEMKEDGLHRLKRYIANSEVCPRRKVDELIE